MDVSKNLCDRGSHTFLSEGEIQGLFCKIISFADLLGGCYLFEILHTSSAVEFSKNVVKTGCF